MAEESYLQPTEPVQPTDAPAQPKFALSAALSSQLEMADVASAKAPSLGATPEPEQETVAPKIPVDLALGHAAPGADLITKPAVARGSLITVVRDPEHKLGKRFDLRSDGSIDKQSRVNVTRGIAVMHQVDTPEAMAALLEAVGKDSHAAIINSSFDGIEPGEEFLIGSAREIEKLTGIPRGDRARQQGVHRIQIGDKHYKMVGRFKENVRPSRWQLLDRDIDVHTPAKYAAMSLEQWVQSVFGLVPGVVDLTYCHAPSTSSRVLRDGAPVGGGNGHVWLQVNDPSDVERARTAILISAADLGLTWLKPRYSRTEPGKVIGHSLATIIDTSVWTPGRLVFVGEPVAGEGLSVAPLTVTIHRSAGAQRLDTSMLVLPDASQIRKITRKAGVAMEVQQGATGLRVIASDLTLDTEIETVDGGIKSVRELVQQGVAGKLRCQTPFRDSSSFAAFYSTNAAGKPFVYDSGTSTVHWLADTEAKGLRLAAATGVVTRMMTKVPADCGAPFEPDAIAALATVQSQDLAEYRRIRADLRKASKDVSVPAVEQAIKEHLEELGQVQTHHGYAVDIIRRLTVDDFAPVGYEGVLYVADPDTGLWVKYPRDALARLVAEVHDGQANCERSSDYSGIAQHIISLATNETFFKDAPVGLACPDGFYQVKDGTIEVVPLTPHHRQRVRIAVTPRKMETPLFFGFLHETLQSSNPDDEAQQLVLVQEMDGAIMLGIAYRYQKAYLFVEPFGRAGKGVKVKITSALVPSSFVAAVSPFVWDREYYIASLAGARLNVVGELPDGEPIPAAAFKTVMGGDLLTGRHPTHRPISFKNEAGHLFSSNHFPFTKDHSEAFFARWEVIEFPNSRLRSGLPLDAGLADRIIAQELPGIAHWALEGAMRVICNGGYSTSVVHDRLMAQWRRGTSSLEEFIHECCSVGDRKDGVLRSMLYQKYTLWCRDSGRKPFSKSRVKELLEHNVGLGISLVRIDGYELFRGVQLKPEGDAEKSEQDDPGGLDRAMAELASLPQGASWSGDRVAVTGNAPVRKKPKKPRSMASLDWGGCR